MLCIVYTHVVNQKAVTGKLQKRPCGTKLHIWSPVDAEDRRAIVLLEGAHNHPTPRYSKVSFDAKGRYQAAVEKVGIMGATAAKVDRGMRTYLLSD